MCRRSRGERHANHKGEQNSGKKSDLWGWGRLVTPLLKAGKPEPRVRAGREACGVDAFAGRQMKPGEIIPFIIDILCGLPEVFGGHDGVKGLEIEGVGHFCLTTRFAACAAFAMGRAQGCIFDLTRVHCAHRSDGASIRPSPGRALPSFARMHATLSADTRGNGYPHL